MQGLERRLQVLAILMATIERPLIGHGSIAQVRPKQPPLVRQLDAGRTLVALGSNPIDVVSIGQLLQVVRHV
ncbi:hypothetical protein D3C71_2107140 [compost metagenome]